MTERNPVRDAVRYALTAGVAASFVGAPASALAQDDVAVQDKVTVTGSRIKRVDIEGPSAVTVINRDDIDASGEISVAEVLRNSTYNTFGSFKPTSGSTAQSQAAISLRGLGAQRTLVLLDGRRITGAPSLGSGSAANLNTIPLAAVERIEILRDGASAIYGSDAIGGVVNIIMRKDYEGMTLSYYIGRPTQTGGDEDLYSIVGGVSGAKGNVTFGLEYEEKDIIFQGDRSFSATGLSSFGFPGSYFAFLTTNDPRNPAQALQDDTDGDGTADSNLGPTFLSVGTFPDPRCPANLNTDPNYPASVQVGSRCRYNYAGVAANEAANRTYNFFLNANYDINETTTFFTRGVFSSVESFGRYAPAPFTSPFPSMSQGNANNPTQPGQTSAENGGAFGGQSVEADTDGDGTADTTVQGPFDLTLFYRNVPGGFRDSLVQDTLVDYTAGLQGTIDWLGGMDWDLAGQYSKQWSDSDDLGYGIGPAFQSGVDDGTIDPHAVNTPFNADQAAAQQAVALTGTKDFETRVASVDGSVNFDAFQMENGAVPVVLGFEYRDDKFGQDYDPQSNAGNVQGTAGGQDVSGARTVKSLFGETSVPILSMLEVGFALRYDDYNDFGTTINPKASLAFRPLDSLLLRATYGQGFRAPSMTELYSGGSQSFNAGIDATSCAADPAGDPNTGRATGNPDDLPPGNPCRVTQYQNFQGGNSSLSAEKSDNWSAGVVWNPLDDLSLAVDYYNIELDDEIGLPSMQQLLDEEFRLRQAGATGDTVGKVTRLSNGRIDFLDRSNANVQARKTDGFDFEGQYSFSLGNTGDYRINAEWTYVNEYEVDFGDGLGFTDPQAFDPENRGTITLNWALGDFGATLTYNYIDEATWEGLDASVDDYKTVDVQVTYNTPWNGTVAVGARNVFDEDPPTSTNIGSPFYTNYLHDVYGRVPYVRYNQDL